MSAYWLGVLTLPAIAAAAVLIWVVFGFSRRYCPFCHRKRWVLWWLTLPLAGRNRLDPDIWLHGLRRRACGKAYAHMAREFRAGRATYPRKVMADLGMTDPNPPIKLELREDF